jgi:hypothetical protein
VQLHQGIAMQDAGVAIRFDRLTSEGVERLQRAVKQLLVGDLADQQEAEPAVSSA